MTDAPTVRDNAAQNQYEITVDGRTALLRYARHQGTIDLIHTEVPPALRGHGLADRLAQAALEAARETHVRVIATCPFVKAYIRRHPEYQALVG